MALSVSCNEASFSASPETVITKVVNAPLLYQLLTG